MQRTNSGLPLIHADRVDEQSPEYLARRWAVLMENLRRVKEQAGQPRQRYTLRRHGEGYVPRLTQRPRRRHA